MASVRFFASGVDHRWAAVDDHLVAIQRLGVARCARYLLYLAVVLTRPLLIFDKFE